MCTLNCVWYIRDDIFFNFKRNVTSVGMKILNYISLWTICSDSSDVLQIKLAKLWIKPTKVVIATSVNSKDWKSPKKNFLCHLTVTRNFTSSSAKKFWKLFSGYSIMNNARHTNSFTNFLIPTYVAIEVSCFDWHPSN